MLINLISIALYASWPQYMAIFLHGAAHNPDVRFTLISNIDEHHPSWEHNFGNITKPNNVVIVPHTFKSIVSLIKKDNLGLGADLSISNPYKLIDFKPMYGVMFAKELIGFTHWGWFDLDIFVGDIKSMYECGYRGEDVLSYDRTIVQGPLMVLRNTEFVNTFYLNLLSTSYMLNHLLQGTAVLFDERYFPNLIKRNASIVSKALQSRDCDPGGHGMWLWYKGKMQQSSSANGPCVIFHFGGKGSKLSQDIKAAQWSRSKSFFGAGSGYSSLDLEMRSTAFPQSYGYGEIRWPKIGLMTLIFKFKGRDNQFAIVNMTTPFNTMAAVKKYSQKFYPRLRDLADRFHYPGNTGQCAE